MILSKKILLGAFTVTAITVFAPMGYACVEHEAQAVKLEPAAGEHTGHAADDGHEHEAKSSATEGAGMDATADHHEAIGLKRVERNRFA